MIASSKLDFDFDDIVIDSVAYRRAMKHHASNLRQDKAHGDLVGGKEGIITDTYRDSASEIDENHGRKDNTK